MDTYQYRARINPHNDLITLAHYHVGIVKQKVEAGAYEGIRLDGMSAVIAMAFAVEAVINYAGAKAVPGWKERDFFPVKIKALEARLKFIFDAGVEPFRTISLVKEARNAIAHGQPEIRIFEGEGGGLGAKLRPSWTSAVEPEFVVPAFDEVLRFKELLFGLAKIKPGAALTSAMGIPKQTKPLKAIPPA